MSISETELPYKKDSSDYFILFADLPWAMYLDSCHPYSDHGRYDIISAWPAITLETWGNTTKIGSHSDEIYSDCDPFTLLKQYLPAQAQSNRFPFSGGAIGYFAYELAHRLEDLPEKKTKIINMPDMAVGIYDWLILTDHQLQKTYLLAQHLFPETDAVIARVLQCLKQQKPLVNDFKLQTKFSANSDYAQYQQAFAKIKNYIYDGDCYQINLSTCFSAEYSGSSFAAYQLLRQENPAAFAAFMNLPQGQVLSLSPERFLQVHEKNVQTKPIKGTRPRSNDPALDQQFAEQLSHSEKDRAENVMIVDLLRNDLSKSSVTGSVNVPQLFALESFPAVHHLVSTVTSTLAPDKHSIDLLRGCFPGGSITGAPKIRAMEIINELETQQRSAYCGSIAYIDYNGNMDSNIAIRTLICHENHLYCSAGGGIVADSQCAAEYQEIHDKIRVIINTLEKMEFCYVSN